ncbi:hypothetical protein [Swaminathania salitolerans]|uniref:Uncharacterized protein n=1 Tax=Swaminathania salitolerans TaxID=182838 RepID=A0A511BL13_9PROT|nr:hypothetical protein [Swaminathania salitolerans]GBQ09256.1 hypothetical protein AA21291_0004 [Swaminathania salitolerans LMG 21291]GEL01040.1 hypothetical protein SSA02_02030 [Swaminathania salitolerans]
MTHVFNEPGAFAHDALEGACSSCRHLFSPLSGGVSRRNAARIDAGPPGILAAAADFRADRAGGIPGARWARTANGGAERNVGHPDADAISLFPVARTLRVFMGERA